ncbi:tripartite tricarboxylate transporter permease [Afipia sp. Root123D2]|uniref:tripartite tricarboxylate transporter permease n=1 Tax=Afipia sp. Root123D2 TaxID=1736436 RepID=UPI0006F36EBC|nr:tripartite tricarboxylate transporter permease [Afipia sp. Root123D2]
MNHYELLLTHIGTILHLKYLVPLIAGTVAGVIGGALPGVTITMTVIMVLPFTFGLDPLQGLAAMIGVYTGGSAGGSITASLIGIPGTPSAVATTFDGYPMTRNGQPGRAVWIGVWAAFLGGAIGGLFLIELTGPFASIALQFGPWEFFSLFIFALTMVAGLVGKSVTKGLLSGAIGLVVTVVGPDPILGTQRLTMNLNFLEGGLDFLPVLIGIFAFAQLMPDVERIGLETTEERASRPLDLKVSKFAALWEILSRPFLLVWSTLIGVLIGILPAIGGSAANIMAYDQAKKFSRHPEKFGTGIPEGVIASESSNNANVAGSLMMIMAFGIPGDAVTAVMLGALTIHGIQPGPLFISQHPDVAYGIYGAYIVSLPLMVLVIWIGSRTWLRVIMMPKSILIPVILVLSVIGAYALGNSMNDVYVLGLFCAIGYAMVKAHIPLAPLILGVVLGDAIESNLIRAVSTEPDPWLFVTRPISGLLLAASIASIVFAIWQHRRERYQLADAEEEDTDF